MNIMMNIVFGSFLEKKHDDHGLNDIQLRYLELKQLVNYM
jgi:hypothetical protein